MTRFDASDAEGRRDLAAAAVRAHRERASPYLTVEAAGGAPWMQYADGVCNLDCTDAELERLKGLLAEFPAFTIADLSSPDAADGTNVRIETPAGPDRLGTFVERVFRTVYDQPADYQLWAAAV